MAKLKSMLIDVSKCMACRGCQVACKQWHDLPAEKTSNRGTYQNPPDLSPITYTMVRFNEISEGDSVNWLFFKDQCRHCDPPPCLDVCPLPGKAIVVKDHGAVIFTDACIGCQACVTECPYLVPRYDYATGKVTKCDLCFDRVDEGLLPACAKACPTGAIKFGDHDEMVKIANKRIEELKGKYPDATLYPGEDFRVMWIITEDESSYQIAKNAKAPSRMFAWRNVFKPFGLIGVGAALLGYLKVKGDNQEGQ